jgi:hypothetical protein
LNKIASNNYVLKNFYMLDRGTAGLGSAAVGVFESDPSIGDAFLASQASATSGARRRRAASTKKNKDDEV